MHASNRNGVGQLKARQERRRVLIPARIKQGAGWTDVCIRNLSPRGLLLHGQSPPRPGSYVEVRRGSYIIVAREYGLRTRSSVPTRRTCSRSRKSFEDQGRPPLVRLPQMRSRSDGGPHLGQVSNVRMKLAGIFPRLCNTASW
jgi:hypothetical protein